MLRLIASTLSPTTGTVAVDGTLAVVRQMVQVDDHETVANLFGISSALAVQRRADAGLATDSDLADVDWTLPDRVATALGRLGLPPGPTQRLATLSGGQRTRAALAGGRSTSSVSSALMDVLSIREIQRIRIALLLARQTAI